MNLNPQFPLSRAIRIPFCEDKNDIVRRWWWWWWWWWCGMLNIVSYSYIIFTKIVYLILHNLILSRILSTRGSACWDTNAPPRKAPRSGRHPRADCPGGHCSGWYASYWNAFLFWCSFGISALLMRLVHVVGLWPCVVQLVLVDFNQPSRPSTSNLPILIYIRSTSVWIVFCPIFCFCVQECRWYPVWNIS